MYYEINVAKNTGKKAWNGDHEFRHLFATAERSITTERELKQALMIFTEKFPYPEYNVSATRWENRGQGLNIEELLK